MADPLLFPDNAAAKIRQLDERVRTLETTNRLLSSAIQGGSLRILDSSGQRVMLLGNLSPGVDGIRLWTDSGTTAIFEANQLEGFSSPWMSTDWKVYGDFITVTSGTFAILYETLNELLFSNQILFRVGVNTAAATTGEMRVMVLGSGQLGSTKTMPANTSANYEFRMTHGLNMGAGPYTFYLEVRVASGAGSINVFQPGGLHYGGNMSTVAGGWV